MNAEPVVEPTAEPAGAGAWRIPPYYQLTRPRIGSEGGRVAFAVRSIKNELRQQGLASGIVMRNNDVFGRGARLATLAFQKAHHLLADGVIGPKTGMALFLPVARNRQREFRIPADWLAGMIYLESAFDPGAEGSFDPRDRGVAQINSRWHPEVPDEIAYGDARFCIRWAAQALRSAHDGLLDDAHGNEDLAWTCAVAHHNNPQKSIQWARSGQPPDEQIETYVRVVRRAADRLPKET